MKCSARKSITLKQSAIIVIVGRDFNEMVYKSRIHDLSYFPRHLAEVKFLAVTFGFFLSKISIYYYSWNLWIVSKRCFLFLSFCGVTLRQLVWSVGYAYTVDLLFARAMSA